MDPLSQGVVGAVFGSLAATKSQLRAGILAGMAGGMAADLDIFIRSASNPLLTIEFHRHFTHSLIFIPIGGFLTTLVLWLIPFIRNRLKPKSLYIITTLGYATSGLLDACTSYGTQLLWPFSNARIAWNNLPIIDPVFTGSLLLLLILAFIWKKQKYSWIALSIALLYPVFGLIQHNRAIDLINAKILERNHLNATRITAKPAPLSVRLWRTIYLHEGKYYVDAFHLPYLDRKHSTFYKGESVEAIDWKKTFSKIPKDSTLYHDLERFAHFSDDYLYQPPNKPEVLADLRYSMIPNSIQPLWGIEFDPAQLNEHVDFNQFRQINDSDKDTFFSMLMGKTN